MMKAPIFITGCPRSGAGLIARIIDFCGADGGMVNSAYENKDINKQIIKPYFEEKGYNLQYPLPELKGLLIPSDIQEKILTLLQVEENNSYLRNDKIWFVKNSALSLMYPIFNYAFPNAKWVIVRRKTSDIILSCLKTAYMNVYEDKEIRTEIGAKTEIEGWKWWVRQYEERFVGMLQNGLNCKVIWPQRMVSGNYQQIYELLEWVGLPWKSQILNFVDPLFAKSRI